MNWDIAYLEKAARKATKGLVPFVENLGSLANDLYRLAETLSSCRTTPFVSAVDPCFRSKKPHLFVGGFFVLAKARRQHAKALFALGEDVCRLPEGLSSFTECGCRLSEVLCEPAMDFCMLAKDLIPRTTGLDQDAEDIVPRIAGLDQGA